MHLLVTRPAPGAEKTAAKLRTLGHQVTIQSLSTMEPTGIKLPAGEYSALAATSAAAFRAAANLQSLTHLPVYCVGDATAAAARSAGFGDINSASGNAGDLFALLNTDDIGRTAPVLYARAEQQSFDLRQAMLEAGRKCVEWVVYRAVMQETLPGDLISALKKDRIDGVLLYSARAAKQFSALCQQHDLEGQIANLKYFCLSPTICSMLPEAFKNRCIAPEVPNEAALLGLLPDIPKTPD